MKKYDGHVQNAGVLFVFTVELALNAEKEIPLKKQ